MGGLAVLETTYGITVTVEFPGGKLYEFEDPLVEVPKMLIGPYQGWQRQVKEKNIFSFQEFLEDDMRYQWTRAISTVMKIKESLPFSSEMMGLVREDGAVICLDGHHRSAALALVAKNKDTLDMAGTPWRIALAVLKDSELALLVKALEEGTEKPL